MSIFLTFITFIGIVLGSTFSGLSTTQTRAKDTERQTDIKAMHGQLEAYYAQNGFYPSLSEMNDASFRQVNMRGLSDDALLDPDGATGTLVSSPTKDAYSYAPLSDSDTNCDNVTVDCVSYTLTAVLEKEGTYEKQSLN